MRLVHFDKQEITLFIFSWVFFCFILPCGSQFSSKFTLFLALEYWNQRDFAKSPISFSINFASNKEVFDSSNFQKNNCGKTSGTGGIPCNLNKKKSHFSLYLRLKKICSRLLCCAPLALTIRWRTKTNVTMLAHTSGTKLKFHASVFDTNL